MHMQVHRSVGVEAAPQHIDSLGCSPNSGKLRSIRIPRFSFALGLKLKKQESHGMKTSKAASYWKQQKDRLLWL